MMFWRMTITVTLSVSDMLLSCTAKKLYGKLEKNIPRKKTALSQS
jgi:hypothetical protein